MTQLLHNVHVYKNNFQRNLSFTVKSLGGHILSRASLTRTVDVTILGAAFLIFLTDRMSIKVPVTIGTILNFDRNGDGDVRSKETFEVKKKFMTPCEEFTFSAQRPKVLES